MKFRSTHTLYLSVIAFVIVAAISLHFSDHQILWCDRPVNTQPITLVKRICFGSCAKQGKEQPLLNDIARLKPDLMVYLGDNIYADTKKVKVMREKYGMLSCKKEFRDLLESTHVIATWDDHDYGQDDCGSEYCMKVDSKKIFLEFWNEPAGSDRYKHEGIYTSYYYGDSAHLVQVILLDLRSFRTPLIGRDHHYQANTDPKAQMMDSTEWNWLRDELRKPATIRIIGSSTQFATDWNGWETWGNYPLQQQKMFDLIKETRSNGVVFISGDVHYSELSMQQKPGMYPIYDMTASGITQVEHHASNNQYRIDKAINTRNFGMIDIDWSKADPEILFRGFDWQAHERIVHGVKLSDLRFK